MTRRVPTLLASACAALIGCASEPAPDAALVSATPIGVLDMAPAIQGRDGGYSVHAWDRSIWLYGDTVLSAPDEDGSTWHHNSVSITNDLTGGDGIGGFAEPGDGVGAPRYFLPPTEDELAFNRAHDGNNCQQEPCGARWAVWPGAAAYDAERDRVLAFYGLIYAEPGDFNFRGVGISLAVWDDIDAAPRRPELSPDSVYPTLLFGEGEPDLGVGALIDDGHLYTFGCPVDFVAHECFVARAPAGEALDRAAWRFWSGADWTADWNAAAVLFEGAPIMDVFYNAFLDRYVAIYSKPFDRDVVLRTAPALTGPWSGELLLFRAESDADVYDALPHREYAEADGAVQYITFSRPTGAAFLASEFPVVRVELARPTE